MDIVIDSKEITRRDSYTLSHPQDIGDEVQPDFELVSDKASTLQNSASDIQLIEDEIFDFDLPVSPERAPEKAVAHEDSTKLDEEEVFFGPVGFTEKCIAAGVAENTFRPLSPLGPEQTAELFKEAYSIAHRIANMKMSENPSVGSPAECTRSASSNKKIFLKQASGDGPVTSQGSGVENLENISPRKRRRSNTFTKDDPEGDILGKDRKRKGTFTKEEPVEALASAVLSVSDAKDKKSANTARTGGIPQRGGLAGSRLQPPASKLRRYNNSQSNLAKPKSAVAEPPGGNRPKDTAQKDGTALGSVPSVTRRSLQLPKACRQNEEKPMASSAGGSLPDISREQVVRPSKLGVRRAQSLHFQSGLPSARDSRLAVPSYKAPATSSGQLSSRTTGESAAPTTTTTRSTGIPKVPSTKLQLMQPGQLQRKSFAVGRGKGAASTQSGPLKAPPPSKAKMGDTVERPYNPALAAAAVAGGNSQCPSTPAAQRRMQPKILSLSSETSTPAKSSCSSSSACGSTPGSLSKKLSLLPMPSQRRSLVSSMPPPSPMSLGSSSSSVSRRSLASSSDACDSPVFHSKPVSKLVRTRHTSGVKGSCTSSDLDGPEASPFAFKSRKPLVQNTPEIQKRTLSKWSPLRKKPATLDDQVSMCTKRVTPT